MKEKSYIKKVFGNSAWVIVSKMINMIVGLAVSICVTRYLGAEQKGAMANATAISSFWGFIAAFGLLDIMISKFSKERENSGKIAATGMTLMLMGGIIAFLFALISAITLGVDREIFIYVSISAFVYIFQCLSVYEFWFYSNSNSKYYAIAQSIIHILFLLLRLIGVPLGFNLLYFVCCAALETIVTYLSLILCYRISKCSFEGTFSFDKSIAIDLVHQALPMIAMGFATTIYMKVDQIMVGKLMGNTELGYYSVAVNLAEYWYFIPAAIYSSFLPIIAASYLDKNDFKNKLQQFADIQSVIGYAAAIGVSLFGKWGVILLYGIEFEQSASILTVYIWSGVFTCISYTGQAFYIVNKDTKTVMWINVIGAVLNFVLNALLITRIGSIGAALATLIEYACVTFGQMVILHKKYRMLYKIQIKSLFPFYRVWKYIKRRIIRREG